MDLIAIDDSSQAAWVFLGNNTLAPAIPTPVPLGDTPGKLAIGDVTGNGIPDLAITLPETSRVIVLPGLGNGQFDNPFYVHTDAAASDVAIIDFNADNKPDLVATLPTIGQVSVHYNLGGQQFAKAQLIPVGDSPRRVDLGDVDEDGQLDLIVANQGDGSVSVIYSRFNPNEVYRYDADAIDPDGDAITYSLVDGPGGLLIDATTGELLWAASPSQLGVHSVTISADDGRGGQATQTFAIEVTPPQDNAAPLLATVPPTEIGADEAFSYKAIAVDADRDALRYRLLEGPEGASMDPTTGLLHWDGRTTGIMAGRADQSGEIRIPADPSLKPDSITIEGWFNLSAVKVAGALINDREDNRYLVTIHDSQSLRVEMAFPDAADRIRFLVDISPETDRWYHIAFTYDAGSGTASLFLDGVLAGSATTRPQPLALDPEGLTYVAHNGGSRGTQGTIDNYRIWNYARSAAEIAEGLSRQYESDPRLVLDYRFDGPDTLNVRDHSIYGNTGYRTANQQMPILAQGLADPRQHRFVVGVEDGRGKFDTQEFIVDVRPPVRGSISGHLFEDFNGNGVQDDGSQGGAPAEPSLQDWLLFIDSNGNSYPDPSEPQVRTDADGNYTFAKLLPGTYPIRVAPMAGYETPSPFAAEAVLDIVEELDAANTTVHELAIQQLALSHIRGRLKTANDEAIANWAVFADLDADGTRDETEPAAVSDRHGDFALTGLDAGTYTLLPELPPGWEDTAGPGGRTVTVGADEISLGNDFVLEPSSTSSESGLHFVTSPHTSVEARQTFRYAALATSITGQPVTYDLSLAPDGMTVDPASGLVAWRPTIDQLGEHTIILRARDASQSVALQDFLVTVSAPNSAPVALVQSLPPHGYVGLVYQADVKVQDAESPSLNYVLTTGPSSATIDSTSGRVTWTPTGTDVGSHDFFVTATDQDGAAAQVTWSVEVRNTAPDELPLAITLPRTTGAIGTRYFSQVRGEDALGRNVRWTVTSIPVGMTIAEDGTIDWTPTANQLGLNSVELTATTLDGTSDVVSFDIEVLGRLRNSAPAITSTPVMQVTLGDTFEYDITASDLDNDVLAYELLEGPFGMSLDASRRNTTLESGG
ncbi:MAG: hypothetical protein KatS3mg111_1817 [Pirellulaceae bacterium]|nr:MAG: hypothetical protein KatS3mg111_1817 [Pirellulaceae bacterium]